MYLAIGWSRSAIPYGPFAISQVEKRGFVREAESQLKIPFGPFPTTPFPLKWKRPKKILLILPKIASYYSFRKGIKVPDAKLYEVQPAG